MAIALRKPPLGCIHHTDRGSQYCAHDYQKILRRHVPSAVPGVDEPLCHGAGGLHPRVGLGEGSCLDPGPFFPTPIFCSHASR